MTPEQGPGAGRIVVGVDGSTPSVDALSWAARQAHLTESSLEVIMTWEWPSGYGWAVPVPDDLDPEADVLKTLASALSGIRVEYPDVHIEPRAVNGHPAPELVEASHGADLLVVGSRGHGEFVGMLLGSVSAYCATNAHCPVVVHRALT